ncbi:endonuclease MutS2 [Edaphobacter acidisoli]|uniref:Endonuclease MutS2 n=1 Tax=Edaphobacter acidisoli TaxID=2040573 RepID=A0A916RX91_9BACT|nr:Smr/MutS family protein [Edaphobacter acidisoli]GGA71253.1 endonuclease MutS2 [Edaphobacter acidisoli]
MNSEALLPHIPSPLTESSAQALEWPRLREHIAGRTSSSLGRTWVLALEPSTNFNWIERQQQRTAEVRAFLTSGGSFDFHGLFDPTTPLEEARIEGSALDALQILSLLNLIERIAQWRNLVFPNAGAGARFTPLSSQSAEDVGIVALSAPLRDHDFSPLLRLLRGKIEPDGSLNDDASPELRRIRRTMERQHRAIEESLRRAARRLREEGSTQSSTEDLITVRGERFVIPVKAEFKRKVPGVIHGSSSSGATVFVEPLETIEQNNELVRLLDEEQAEIHRILVAMTHALGEDAAAIHAGACILAEVESHFARARFANDLNCTRPQFLPVGTKAVILSAAKNPRISPEAAPILQVPHPSQSHREGWEATDLTQPQLTLINARHPLLELRMKAEARAAGRNEASTPVPLTITLPSGTRQLIISGPNTGGKTVSLKTLGLLALMAQAGIPVPADEAALPLFTSIYADIGDAQSIERNLSSFSAHVVNLDRISREATPSSLVLLDELGSATDPEEGAALAVAVAEHFLTRNIWCAITTHLTSLKVYAANHAGVLNAAVGFDQQTLTPTYQLRLGVPGASAGLNIAQRLGLEPAIIAAARAQMTTQTADIGAFLDHLHEQLVAATAERESLQQREREVSREKMRLDLEGRAEQKARIKELEARLNKLLAEFESQLKESVKSIGDKAIAKKLTRDSASAVARARREFSEQFNTTVLAHTTGADKAAPTAEHPIEASEIKPGDKVKLKSLGREARVERIIDTKTFEVSIGPMKMRAAFDDIAALESSKSETPLQAARRRGGVTIATAIEPDYVPSEINVIGRTADEAHDEVERFLDRAFLAGLPRIRIVHGTGMGILRRTLREYLRNHPHVTSVTEPPHNQGGQGATEVELRQ